jgi:uncharacterized protein
MRPSNLEGFGLGLRPRYYSEILDEKIAVDWFEVITENFLVPGGKPLAMLDRVRAEYPIVLHGVSLSIASTEPIDFDYLHSVRELAVRVDPAWVSDHLCWTGVHGINLHDLLPIPYTTEALNHVAERIDQVQTFLKRPIVIENVSSYLTRLLLDVNNVFVSAFNRGTSAEAFIDALPVEGITQIHLAGHSHLEGYKIDTHDQGVCGDVWTLYGRAIQRFGFIPTMIERDDNFPPLQSLLSELDHAREVATQINMDANTA